MVSLHLLTDCVIYMLENGNSVYFIGLLNINTGNESLCGQFEWSLSLITGHYLHMLLVKWPSPQNYVLMFIHWQADGMMRLFVFRRHHCAAILVMILDQKTWEALPQSGECLELMWNDSIVCQICIRAGSDLYSRSQGLVIVAILCCDVNASILLRNRGCFLYFW